jgi:hypothetical protein
LGQAGYVIGLALCLAALSFPISTWLAHPEKWLVALAGLLFFGGGAVALLLLWQADRQAIPGPAREARRTVVLGICSVLLGLASALLAVVDNSTIGIALLGALFFGLGGAVLIWRGLSANQSDPG